MLFSIGLLQEKELEKADQVFKLAFGTFRKDPNPSQYAGDMTYTGFQADRIGVAMHKPNESAFNRSQVYVIDDWR